MNDVSESVGADASDCGCDCTCDRDRHLFCKGPKRILAFDGGGVRGAVSVAFLEEIEAVLARRLGREVLLGHWFDLIGGTSTGAIIGGALAMGFSSADVKRFYHELAPKVFVRPRWRLPFLMAKFDAKLLRDEIQRIIGKCTLGSEDLMTGFSLVAKRVDTGSTWILDNNKRGDYWDGSDDVIGNKDYELGALIRASTAAPLYFDPEEVVIAEARNGMPAVKGWFVDGGVTAHNNPSIALMRLALLDAYRLRWATGPENLTIVSIGTGTHRTRVTPDDIRPGRSWRLALHSMLSMMGDVHENALTEMQYLGETLTPWWINGQLRDMRSESPPHGKLFRFIRYDVRLELGWINESKDRQEKIESAFGRTLTETDMIRMRSLDDPTIIEDLYKVARIAAKEQVREEHWQGALPVWCGGRTPSAARRTLPPTASDRSGDTFRVRASRTISEALSYARARLARAVSRREPPAS